MTTVEDYLLDDAQMRAFIVNGYLKFSLPTDPGFHEACYAETEKVFAAQGNPGDDVYDAVPMLKEVFDHPLVVGTLTSILGEDYFMYPHRHCHLTPPRRQAQHDHKDSIPADHFVRHHRVRWAMAFYYPQDTPMAIGPTGVRPGTQYFITPDAARKHDEIPLVAKAGDIVFVHYDVWHRGLSNNTDRNRYMNKFLFCRSSEPVAPSWYSDSDMWMGPQHVYNHNADPIWQSIWNWHLGRADDGAGANGADLDALGAELDHPDEHRAMNAAYRLGAAGEDGCGHLFDYWTDESVNKLEGNVSGRFRNPSELLSTHGLTAANGASVERLQENLGSEHWWLRASAADRLGDIGVPARGAIPALIDAMEDDSEWVRRNAAFSLGILDDDGTSAAVLGRHLSDVAARVAQNSSLALCKMARNAQDATEDLKQAVSSDVKYVKSNSQLALHIMDG